MVSSVTSSAAFSSALQSGSQCRGSRDTQAQQGMQALQEKMFTKLDANGDGGIDKTELSDFMSFAASSSGTGATDSSELFSSLDADGDGAINQTELSDGAKSLFDQLRTQLMTAAASKAADSASIEVSGAGESKSAQSSGSQSAGLSSPDELFAKLDANGDGTIDKDELGSFMEANRPPPPPDGAGPGGPGEPGGHSHGMFSKIESLLDQYRSNATSDTSAEAEATSTLSIAA